MLPLRILNRLCLKVLKINRLLRHPWPASNGSWMFQRLSGQSPWNEGSDNFPEVLKQVQPFLVGVLAYSDPSVSPKNSPIPASQTSIIFDGAFCFKSKILPVNERLSISHHPKRFWALGLQAENAIKLKRSPNLACWKAQKVQNNGRKTRLARLRVSSNWN